MQKPTLEDVLELSGIELLHPGGFDITRRIGEIVEMKGKRVLDVSCGRGILPAFYAKNFGVTVVGIDLSPKMIRSSAARAKREGVESQTEFKVANSLALPFDDCRFDVAVNECAVGLTPDPQKCLDEMARVTRRGGYVVIHESTWLKEMSQREKADVARRLGTVPYTLAEWKGMMASAGLTDLWAEDWSTMENAAKIRPDRNVKSPSDVFSLWEIISSILPRLISKYGIGSVGYVYQSMRKVSLLYLNGTLGYSLLRGQKP